MAPKKRTDPTRRTSSTSPTTSTSHASVDEHHRLRHAGPSISTRSSVAASSKPPPAPAHPEKTPLESSATEKSHREKKLLAEVSPPGARSSFSKFLYVLLFIVLLLFGWYLYGMITLLAKLKEEVGWWGIITGDLGGQMRWETSEGYGCGSDQSGWQGGRAKSEKGGALESSLNALADALGIPSIQVASAVKPLVQQARLTSIASKSEETGGSEAVRILLEDTRRKGGNSAETARRIAREFAEKMNAAGEHVAESDDMV